jgi:lipopolysaccharide biosynthesis glycosyltransferase
MIIPPLLGKLSCQNFFIYAAFDQTYFDNFAKILINSIKANSSDDIHIHIFNPRQDQLEFCRLKNISVTYEFVATELFQQAADKWTKNIDAIDRKNNYDRTLNAMGKGGDKSLVERIQKTYFACARFIRLAEIIENQTVFSIDVDAVVRNNIPKLPNNKDLYIHFISGKKARYLAGGIFLNLKGQQFIKDYSTLLKLNIEKDDLYWGIDQDILDIIVPKYDVGALPMTYIDWNMSPGSYIWTAKGTRKELPSFINEQKKYNS